MNKNTGSYTHPFPKFGLYWSFLSLNILVIFSNKFLWWVGGVEFSKSNRVQPNFCVEVLLCCVVVGVVTMIFIDFFSEWIHKIQIKGRTNKDRSKINAQKIINKANCERIFETIFLQVKAPNRGNKFW